MALKATVPESAIRELVRLYISMVRASSEEEVKALHRARDILTDSLGWPRGKVEVVRRQEEYFEGRVIVH